MQLKNLHSIINNSLNAKDYNRAFSFIEFIKEFGYDNSPGLFLSDYKEYLTQWNNIKNSASLTSDKEFIKNSLINTLKSIIITYSSYEEQDFIANINWDNEEHRKAIIPFFAEKIKLLCEFYKAKRQEAPTIINKNKFKGSRASIEQIIYDKILDFYFENRNLSYQNLEIKRSLQNNLSISIEQYVDIYSDYFDIPRNKKYNDKTRAKFLSANINMTNYEDYLKVARIISDTLFTGEVYLEEIPLIASMALDLSKRCAGEVSTLRDNLLREATINFVSINDQIALRRKLYEKFLGCDLYYIYCDTKDSIYMDILTKAANPSGNLLNCGTSDTAVVEANELKLLSNIGLFFKPDKTGVIQVSADNFKWSIDRSKLQEETFYVFPDPKKYGDIGNNKNQDYPLIFEFKLDSYIKNISSGWAKDEPLVYLSSPSWNTYYSNQDRDYVINQNQNFDYSFTSLANCGILRDYQVDLYGNEFGLFKGYNYDESNKTLYVNDTFTPPEIVIKEGGTTNSNKLLDYSIHFNGGYYSDPRFLDKNVKFPDDYNYRWDEKYIWTGIKLDAGSFTSPSVLSEAQLDMGDFNPLTKINHIDHYKKIDKSAAKNLIIPVTRTRSISTTNNTFSNKERSSVLYDNKSSLTLILDNFVSTIKKIDTDETTIVKEKITFDDLKNKPGELYVKEFNKLPSKPKLLRKIKDNTTTEIKISDDIISYSIYENLLVLETSDYIYFFEENITNGLSFYEIMAPIELGADKSYKILFNETNNTLIIAIINSIKDTNNGLYKGIELELKIFDITNKKLIDFVYDKSSIAENFIFFKQHTKINNFIFSYNSNLKLYLIAYLINNTTKPYLYQHIFKMETSEQFINTLTSEVFCFDEIPSGDDEIDKEKFIFDNNLLSNDSFLQ